MLEVCGRRPEAFRLTFVVCSARPQTEMPSVRCASSDVPTYLGSWDIVGSTVAQTKYLAGLGT